MAEKVASFPSQEGAPENQKTISRSMARRIAALKRVDLVNHPPHYKKGKFEVIDIIKDQLTKEEFTGFLMGNVIKYLLRYKNKGGAQDLQKGSWYLKKLTDEISS